MIARLIRLATGVNPSSGIDDAPAVVTLPDGSKPTPEMGHFPTWPVGTTLEHPDCWQHCLYGAHNTPPIAEPADDECRRIVAMLMQKREADIQDIRERALELDGKGKAGKFLNQLAKDYGVSDE